MYLSKPTQTLYNLVRPGSAVSCVADKPVSHCAIYTFVSYCCILFRSISLLAMDAFTSDKWILLASFIYL